MQYSEKNNEAPKKQTFEEWLAAGNKPEWIRPKRDPYTGKPIKMSNRSTKGKMK